MKRVWWLHHCLMLSVWCTKFALYRKLKIVMNCKMQTAVKNTKFMQIICSEMYFAVKITHTGDVIRKTENIK